MEIEAEIDRRLREIRVRARASEAADEPAPTSTPSPATHVEAASGLARTYGLGYHLGRAVERILDGAAEGERGRRSLEEACRLIESYMALVEQQSAGVEVHGRSIRLRRPSERRPLKDAPATHDEARVQQADIERVTELQGHVEATSSPAPESVPRQLALMALHFVVVAAVTIGAIVVFALIVDLR